MVLKILKSIAHSFCLNLYIYNIRSQGIMVVVSLTNITTPETLLKQLLKVVKHTLFCKQIFIIRCRILIGDSNQSFKTILFSSHISYSKVLFIVVFVVVRQSCYWTIPCYFGDSTTKLDKIGQNWLKLVQIGPNEGYSVVSLFIWPDELDKS